MGTKNVILVVIDSLRKDHVGVYGNEWINTPNLDSFFSDGVKFTNAYPESIPTIPFRRSLHTGKRTFPFRDWKPFKAFYPLSNFGAMNFPHGWTPIPDNDITLADYLNDKGYNTSLITDCFHQHYPGMNFHRGYHSWDFIRGQEYDLWKNDTRTKCATSEMDYITEEMVSKSRKPWELRRYLINNDYRQNEEEYFPAQVFRSASNWLEKNYQNENFFLCIDCFDPHEPWDPPQHYRDMYDPDYNGREVLIPLYSANWQEYMSESELNHMKALYAAECSMVDFWFGHFINKIKMLGLDKNTLVLVVSDHGHQLGENGFTGKVQWGLLPCLVDLVLGIRFPDQLGKGQECSSFVLNHDLFPTILNFLGEEIPGQSEGIDLHPIIKGEQKNTRDYITTCYKDFFLVKDDQYALITKNDKSSISLFDIKEDPTYQNNLADKLPQEVNRLWDLLLSDAGGDIPIYDYKETLIIQTMEKD